MMRFFVAIIAICYTTLSFASVDSSLVTNAEKYLNYWFDRGFCSNK